MKVFITGGSGFIGRAAIEHLVAQGHEVFALARSAASRAAVEAAGARAVAGDLTAETLPPLQGAEALVHAAAPVVFWGPWAMYEREVVQATRAWYLHAAAQGVRRFVQISSESVMQQGYAPLLDVDESHPVARPPNSDYGRAKLAAEEALVQAAPQAGACEWVVLRPTFVWGPGVAAVQTMAEKVRQGQFVWLDEGRHAFERVHVRNVAQAIGCAVQRGRGGQVYLITDGVAGSVRGTLAPLLQAAGVAVPTRSMPSALVQPLAAATEWLWRALGRFEKPPPLTRFDVAFVSQPRRYRIDKARRELGYEPAAFDPAANGR